MKKIDITKIRGRYDAIVKVPLPDGSTFNSYEAGDDTEKSLKTIAEKVNEIIDLLNREII
jgi:hypothetical protein